MIGKSPGCDVVVDDPYVSGVHCLVERRKGGYMIFDNGSTNGIKYKEERRSDLALTNGMKLEIGDVPVEFTLTEEECDYLTEERFKERKKKEAEEESSDAGE